MAVDHALNIIFGLVMVLGWIVLVGLLIFFLRRAPKDGPDAGPNAKPVDSEDG